MEQVRGRPRENVSCRSSGFLPKRSAIPVDYQVVVTRHSPRKHLSKYYRSLQCLTFKASFMRVRAFFALYVSV